MPDSIPPPLLNAANRKVFGYLADKSAHPDIADVLRAGVKPLGDVQVFCPDWRAYRFVTFVFFCKTHFPGSSAFISAD